MTHPYIMVLVISERREMQIPLVARILQGDDLRTDGPWLAPTLLRILYSVAAIFVILVILSTVDRMLGFQVQQSDDVLWQVVEDQGEHKLMVVAVSAGGVGEEAGIETGDRVLAINDVPIPATPQASMFAQRVLNISPTDRLIPYRVERNGQVVDLRIQIAEIFPIALLVFPTFGLLWLLIGLVAALARPTGRVQQLFFLAGLSIFFAVNRPGTPDSTVALLWYGASAIFFYAWVRFADTFPINQGFTSTRVRKALLFFPLLLMTGTFTWLFYSGSVTFNSPLARIMSLTNVLLYGLFYLAGIVLLFRGYLKMNEEKNRRPMQIILAGVAITTTSFFLVIWRSDTVASFSDLDLGFLAVSLPVIALPLSFGYAIFRYQLMDVRAIFRTALIYLITTGAIVGLYLLIAINLGRFLGDLFGVASSSVIETVILLLFVLLFEPVRRWVARLVEERFFPEYSDYSTRVTRFSRAVAEEIGVDRVADRLRRTLQEELTLDPVDLVLFEDGEETTRIVGRERDQTSLSDADFRALREIAGERNELIPLSISSRRAARQAFYDGYHFATPLLSGGRTIGLLLLGDREDGRTIHGSQIPFIKSVAAQTASAIEAERLYTGELERRAYLQELATAQRIQESLLPSEPPQIAGLHVTATSRPARTVGGDYYEVILLDEHRLFVMIADVSGKGLPASLYMAELHGMVRIVAGSDASPAAMLRLLNRRLVDVLKRGTFVTASIGIVDTAAGELTLSRAGHTPLLRTRMGELEHFTPLGLPLGLPAVDLFDEKIEEITIPLSPGDRFLFYSDGISEGMNREREEYGVENMEEALLRQESSGGAETIDALIEDVDRFSNGAEQNDDITLLLVEVGTRELREDERSPERGSPEEAPQPEAG